MQKLSNAQRVGLYLVKYGDTNGLKLAKKLKMTSRELATAIQCVNRGKQFKVSRVGDVYHGEKQERDPTVQTKRSRNNLKDFIRFNFYTSNNELRKEWGRRSKFKVTIALVNNIKNQIRRGG